MFIVILVIILVVTFVVTTGIMSIITSVITSVITFVVTKITTPPHTPYTTNDTKKNMEKTFQKLHKFHKKRGENPYKNWEIWGNMKCGRPPFIRYKPFEKDTQKHYIQSNIHQSKKRGENGHVYTHPL